MNPALTLLFGMPRSGTTWIAKIFDSHPDTLYRHEPDTGGTLNGLPFFPKTDEWEKHRGTVESFVRGLSAMNSARVAGSLPIFPKNYSSGMRMFFQRAGIMATWAAEAFGWELPVPSVAAGTPGIHLVWKSIESPGRLGLRPATEIVGALSKGNQFPFLIRRFLFGGSTPWAFSLSH